MCVRQTAWTYLGCFFKSLDHGVNERPIPPERNSRATATSQRSNAASADAGNNFIISINVSTWSGT